MPVAFDSRAEVDRCGERERDCLDEQGEPDRPRHGRSTARPGAIRLPRARLGATALAELPEREEKHQAAQVDDHRGVRVGSEAEERAVAARDEAHEVDAREQDTQGGRDDGEDARLGGDGAAG